MKTMQIKSMLLIAAIGTLLSCQKESAYEETAASDTMAIMESKADEPATKYNDGSRQFLRKADLNFTVKNVSQATEKIELLSRRNGAYVTDSRMSSSEFKSQRHEISADSVLEITEYNTSTNMTIRVPNKNLDTLISQISTLVDFWHYRNISATDVSIEILDNALQTERNLNGGNRISKAIDTKGTKLNSIVESEETLIQRQAAADQGRLNNLRLKDEVNFSTITLQMRQPNAIKTTLLPQTDNFRQYEPNIFIKLKSAIVDGWYILEYVLVFLIKLWGVALAVFLFYKATMFVIKKTSKV